MGTIKVPPGQKFWDEDVIGLTREGQVDVQNTLIYLGQDGQRFFIGFRQFVGELMDRSSECEDFTFEAPSEGPVSFCVGFETFTVINATNEYIELELSGSMEDR